MRLDGIRVLDLSRLLPGPYATHLLAEAGADVIKIEDTEMGDYARYTPPPTNQGFGVTYDAINRGKRSVSVDLSAESGREVFFDLVEDADVVFEQFRPGVVERLGVDYETVRKHNQEIVYCSLSGYGQNGPYRDRVGHDLNYAATAGLLDMTRRDRNEKPRIPGIPVGDMSGGLFAAVSMIGAVLSRELGNSGGEYVDVSMTDAVISFSQALVPEVLAGRGVSPGETRLTGKYPCYGVYETADGRYATLAALEPKFWQQFCETVGREELVDKHMSDSPEERAAVREAVAEVFAEKTRDEWEAEIGGEEMMFAAVNRVSEAIKHQQVEARELIIENGAPRVGFPIQGSEGVPDAEGPAPGQGEHTDDVLQEAGYATHEIARLREDGVLK
jgi:crotonobetainyl-CoA:carnitine CoA-transferase CaiB-like acyl-CoA transferase